MYLVSLVCIIVFNIFDICLIFKISFVCVLGRLNITLQLWFII